MRSFLRICAGVVILLTAVTAFAADVSGTWIGTAEAPNGEYQLTFTFRQDGERLTGTMEREGDDPIAFSEGKINGNEFTFEVPLDDLTTIHGDCTVEGDQIKISMRSDNEEFQGLQLTVKRSSGAQ